MAWEKEIIGYKIVKFSKQDVIPIGAIYIRTYEEFVRMYGWASNPKPYYQPLYEYQVPIYKKKNIKRK